MKLIGEKERVEYQEQLRDNKILFSLVPLEKMFDRHRSLMYKENW
jgi:hypothetical protein